MNTFKELVNMVLDYYFPHPLLRKHKRELYERGIDVINIRTYNKNVSRRFMYKDQCGATVYLKDQSRHIIFMSRKNIEDNGYDYDAESILYHELGHIFMNHDTRDITQNLQREVEADYVAMLIQEKKGNERRGSVIRSRVKDLCSLEQDIINRYVAPEHLEEVLGVSNTKIKKSYKPSMKLCKKRVEKEGAVEKILEILNPQ